MARKKMSWYDLLAFILLIVGGLNWGLVALLDFNVVSLLFGVGSLVSQLVYVAVFLSAIYGGYALIKLSK